MILASITWTPKYISSQICAIVAAIFVAASFFAKNKKIVLISVTFGSFFYAVHYLLLGAYAGAIIDVLSSLRCIWFYFNTKADKKLDYVSLTVCSVAFIAGGILTYKSWPDILTILAAINTTIATWQPSICYYRWACIVGSCFWIAYSILCHSIFGFVQEVLLLVLEIISIIIYYVDKHKQAQNTLQQDTPSNQTIPQ